MDSRFVFGVVAVDEDFGGVLTAAHAEVRDEMLAPRMRERPAAAAPAIRVPRSAKRGYSAGELQAAAVLLGKLRRREDTAVLAVALCEAEYADDLAVNRTVDRLLDVM